MRRLGQRLSTAALLVLVAAAPVAAAEAFASATEIRPLLLGTEVPAVEVLGLDGKPVDLRAVIGSKDAVVIFYRGGW
jgi:hypothetical protein